MQPRAELRTVVPSAENLPAQVLRGGMCETGLLE